MLLPRLQNRVFQLTNRLANQFRADASRRLVVFDDIFPHPLSAFRMAEFTCCLETFPFAEVHSSGAAFPVIHETQPLDHFIQVFAATHPALASRVFEYAPARAFPTTLTYCVFLHNITSILDHLERHRGAFVFTLYPGGGFRLDVPDSDAMLKRALTSPGFRKVIATQKVTRDYLLDKRWCAPDQIEFIYGGVFPPVHFSTPPLPRRVYGLDKDTIDLGFVAYKYMPGGRDKGFDLFIECAARLAGLGKHIRFHVVGPFSESDADTSGCRDQLHFHGPLLTADLRRFYSTIDMIVSPNAPFILGPGMFDGFPTACCVEAALCGVAVFSTDALHENQFFKDGREIVIISREPGALCDQLEHYLKHYDQLRAIGSRSRAAFRQVFGWEPQILPRLRLLSRHCRC